MRIRPCGSRALLLELDDLEDARDWYATLLDAELPGVVDLVPAARTVLVVAGEGGASSPVPRSPLGSGGLTPSPTLDDLVQRLRTMRPARGRRPAGAGQEPLEVPVVYDGEDLAEVADLLGVEEAELVRRHTGQAWTVAFCGFAPGYGYLVPEGTAHGLEWGSLPRRHVPRTRVPAGAVAVAGRFTGIYPSPSPGGWQLIGRTALALFDADREPAALLVPGRRVRFRDVTREAGSLSRGHGWWPPWTGRSSGPGDRPGGSRVRASVVEPVLTVVRAGPSTTTQDDGRPGAASIGVSPSGAADRASYRLANRLVGNRSGAAALEVTAGGLVLRAVRHVLVAVTGAPCAGAPHDGSVWLRAGDELTLGTPSRGLRTYVAVRGGVEVPQVMGSRSVDVLSGLGPAPLRAGDLLALAGAAGELPSVDVAPRSTVGVTPGTAQPVRLLPGPRLDWFTEAAWRTLTQSEYRVTQDSNRVGLRLDGPGLARAVGDELPSEGLVRGAVQVPPSGLPLVFLADHPTTGGYPVIACAVDEDVDALGQLRPGDAVRFTPATSDGFGTPEARV
ncbi:MAG TPA: urea amidolyase family protein [Actinomycetales bacterium]|nr:urea amidolyase family protein [Actinomycetales bacterium]